MLFTTCGGSCDEETMERSHVKGHMERVTCMSPWTHMSMYGSCFTWQCHISHMDIYTMACFHAD